MLNVNLKKLWKVIEEKRYFGGYSIYPGKGKITDKEVVKFALKHLHWWDRLDPRKVGEASLVAWHIKVGVCTPEEFSKAKEITENWKFK